MLVNLTEAAKLAGVSRTTLYAKLKNGTLSESKDRQGNRQVDTSELLRVFGELKAEQPATRPMDAQVDAVLHPVDAQFGHAEHGLIAALRDQIDMLKAQVEEAKQRESELMDMLKQRLIADQTGREEKPRRWWSWRKAA